MRPARAAGDGTAVAAGGPVRVVVSVGRHPAVDESTEQYVVFATPSPTVRFTEPFAAFVAEAVERGVRPVLITTTTGQVSPFVSSVMRQVGGAWALQARDRTTYDALSGRKVGALTDLWEGTDTKDRLPGFTDPPVAPQPVVTFDVYTHQRAETSSRIGVVADDLGDRLGTQWRCWSTREPLLEPWNGAAVTLAARRHMPESAVLLVSGTGGAFAQVQVARTRTGIVEHTEGGVPVPSSADPLELATTAAETLARTHNPAVAVVSLAEYDADGTGGVVQAARARPVDAPLVVLVGPRAVRDLGVDAAALAREHDVRTVGRAKLPCLLVRFDGPEAVRRWEQMARFAEALGPANIRRVLGWEG